MLPVLTQVDPLRYPDGLTEGGQFQYLVAGKGIYRIFAREAEIAGFSPGEVAPWFSTPADSKRVFALWAGARGSSVGAGALEGMPRSLVGRLAPVADRVVHRGLNALAAITAAALARESLSQPGIPFSVFVEGSIARNPLVRAGVEERFRLLAGEAAVFEAEGCVCPPVPAFLYPPGNDLTLLGAAALAVTRRFRACHAKVELQSESQVASSAGTVRRSTDSLTSHVV
jgi:hypothetical protein